jgi:nucleotide-binding universal stress UspA family protein
MIGEINTEGLEVEFIVDISKHPYQGIVDIVHGREADLLVVGARGQSKTAAILLGSVTERLIDVCNVPILVVKKKGQGLSVLKAMFGL